MPHPSITAASTPDSSPDLLDNREVRKFFGGTRPIDNATLYRGIKAGRYPRPLKVSANSNRWLRRECEQARNVMIQARAGGQ